MTVPGAKEPQANTFSRNSHETANAVKGVLVRHWKLLVICLAALTAVGMYAGAVLIFDDAGYPLDDSWIHQTYARNFARTGRWEYVPGEVSAGSTAPLWTLILSFGYLIRAPYIVWSLVLGWLCLAWNGWGAARLWRILWPEKSESDWISGLVLVLSWPLIWSAGSGMETLLFTALSLEVLYHYMRLIRGERVSSLLIGITSGFLVLTRPEGIGLLALIALGIFQGGGTWRQRVSRVGQLLIGAAIPTVPYFTFNFWLSGNLWPNTFYAKQVEYASAYSQSLLLRFSQLLYYSLGGAAEGWRGISGAHLLLLPGVIAALIAAVMGDWNSKRFFLTLPLAWAAGIVFVYAWRLPVTYQHGRYLFPVLPIWTVYGLRGWQEISSKLADFLREMNRLHFILTRVGAFTFGVLLLLFLLLGLQVYIQDVSFVNGEMVSASRWLRDNSEPEDLVAAHDIGAIGYFAERPILDLAGLISPEVIPLLSNEESLIEYVLESESEYLVTAPGWTYDSLTASDTALFQYSTDYEWTQSQGYNNMEIYLLLD